MENVITNPFQAQVISILESVLDTDEKRNQLDLFHDYELAQSLLEMDERQRLTFYSLFSDSQLAQIIAQLPPLEVIPLLQNMSKKLLMSMLNQMQTDDLVDIIESIEPEEDRLVWLAYISPKRRNEVLGLLDFDPALVGSIMNPNFIAIKRADTVKSAIKKMVDQAPYTEFINNLFVLEEGRLVGVLSLKEIISAGHRPTDLIEDIMTTNIITVTPWTSNEEAIELMKNYDFLLLPVVDQKRKLLGIIAFDDMFEALNKESDEDYSKLAGLTEISIDEDRENVFSSVRKRMPWLVILLFVNLITSSIITGFEGVLTLIPTLALFMPLILNLAGNTGTQSLGIIIRLFATNQLETRKDVYKHLFKEFLTGLVNGVIIAIMLFVLVIVMRMIQGIAFVEVLPFASVIALSISVSLIVATLAGALVPLLISLFKADPAVASGPFITTINDIISLLIYFGLASLLLASYI